MVSFAEFEPEWNNDGLADDVAVFSGAAPPRKPVRSELDPHTPRAGTGEPASSAAAPGPERLTIFEFPRPQVSATLPAKDVKCASITIRMSAAECMQLRSRAAESGMTISAYLRSCTLEVESLRTQVKEALAQMQAAPAATQEKTAAAMPRATLLQKVARVWPPARAGQAAQGACRGA